MAVTCWKLMWTWNWWTLVPSMSVIVHCNRWNVISGLSRPDSWRIRPVFVRKKATNQSPCIDCHACSKNSPRRPGHLKTASDENERLSFQDALRTMSRLCLHRYRPRDRRWIPPFTPTRQPPNSNLQCLGNPTSIQKQFSVGRRPN